MTKQILAFFLFLASVFVTPAIAQETELFPRGDFSELQQAGIAEVAQIIDPQTLQLHDGRIVRLTGLYFPDYGVQKTGDFSLIAVNILRDMLEGQAVMIYQTRKKDWGRTNRMRHQIAHIERKSDQAWVQGTLISLGLAQVMTAQRNPEMAAQM